MKPQILIASLILMMGPLTACNQSARGAQGAPVYEYEKTGDRLNQGGADTGGGAGADGRMLEAYEVRISETPEFQAFVKPLIEQISLREPAFAADLMHIALHRKWYILPTNLGKIPASDMVAGIRADDVEQLAVQTEAEVWIDKRPYTPMLNRERGQLIVHELVMGVRLMEYQPPFDQCLAEAALHLIKDGQKAYRDKKKACSVERLTDLSSNFRITKKKIKLSNADYDAVRQITLDLINESSTLSAEELQKFALVDLRRGITRPPTE